MSGEENIVGFFLQLLRENNLWIGSYGYLGPCFCFSFYLMFRKTVKYLLKTSCNFGRYWSHVVNCKSCNLAYKSLNVVEVALQIISVASIGIVAAMKEGMLSAVARNSLVVTAVLSFALSRWLAHFIYKTFRYHDYDHAFR